MAKVSFKSKEPGAGENQPVIEAEVTPVEEGTPNPEGVVATRPEQPLATNNAPASAANFAGDWDADDIRLSRVNLVHKTSNEDMIENFGIGAFVLDREVQLSDGKTPIILTATRMKKDFIRKVPFGSGFDATVLPSLEAVRQAGGSTNYKDYTQKEDSPFFQRRAHVELVLQLPEAEKESETADALFPYEFEGKSYTRAVFTVSSSAYTSVAVEIATLANKNKVMRQGTQYGNLELTSKTVPGKNDMTWKVPVVKFAGANTPEFVAFVNGLIGL